MKNENILDHETTFQLLSNRIESDVTSNICRLNSMHCTNLKNTFSSICGQLGIRFQTEATIRNIEESFEEKIEEMITLIFEDCEALDAKTFSNTLEIIANAQSKA